MLLLLHTIKRSSTFPVAIDVGVFPDEDEALPLCVITAPVSFASTLVSRKAVTNSIIHSSLNFDIK